MLSTLLALIPLALPQDPAAGDGAPSAERQEVRPMPIPRTLVFQRGDRRVEIDGSLQDWPPLPPVGLDDPRQLSGTAWGAWRGQDDCAARLFLMWDAEALWIGAVVLDDWHVNLRKDSPRLFEIPPADSLTVTIDPRRDTEALGMDPGRVDDACFWIADVEGQGKRVVAWDRYRGTATFANASEAAVIRNDDERVTFYEARIAWADVLPEGAVPDPRTVMDVQFVVDDFDEPTDLLAQTRVGWNFGMGPRIDPGLFGSMMLADVTAAEIGGGGFALPDFPAPPEREVAPLRPESEWVEFLEALRATSPEPATRDTVDVRNLGGAERRRLLERLERDVADFPRADYLGFLARTQRRMNRECEGIVATGVPYLLDQMVQELTLRLAVAPPENGVECIRLPFGGWLLRSRTATIAIDPVGYRLDRILTDRLDAVLLTRSGDPSRRNDPLLVGLLTAEPPIPVLMHVAVHLPSLAMKEQDLVTPGAERTPHGLVIRALGKQDDEGRVSAGMAYHVRYPDGTDVVVSSTSLDEEDVREAGDIELLILSPFHPRAQVLAQRIAAGTTVLDDAFRCSVLPGAAGRATLESIWELQDGLRPGRSVLLAPGERITVTPEE